MLGIGMQEMMIIALAALLIFGPGKLPEVMGQAGKFYKQFRDMTGELTGEFEKTIAEAKEMGNQLTGELGPMQKELQSVTNSAKRDLNKAGKSTTSSASKAKSTTSKSTTSSTNKGKSTTTTSRTSSTTSTSSKSATTSRTSSTSSTASKKPAAPPVATKDDPVSDFSMFTQEAPERTRRSRRATPSVIADPTPRLLEEPSDDKVAVTAPDVSPVDSALARARQRRQQAGYAQRSA
ncbi:MAG TPA: twin-arginine translocase TatA/TatE family subunit [Thermomicrobiales bacterium]|nr:twin-arginine translocase TatA/TatE family subunit [Thermomicrobiales bacterium]